MKRSVMQALVAGLRKGQLGDAQPWEVAEAVRHLLVARPNVDEMRAAAKALNKRLYFDQTRVLAQAWGKFDPTIEKHHAQALINLSSLDEAEAVLEAGLRKVKAAGVGAQAQSELPEFEGLLGRLWKQRFVESGSRDALATSLNHYRAQYDSDPSRPFWHGINIAALLARQEREGAGAVSSSASIAQAVYEDVAALAKAGQADQWAIATASEACLALGRCDEAELWLYRFLRHPQLQPFDADSYGRQLREIWQGDATSDSRACANRLVAIIEGHFAGTQGRWSVSGRAIEEKKRAFENEPSAHEKNFSGQGSFSRETVSRMLDACSAVGCVCSAIGERLGTGFVLPGRALAKGKDFDGPVFVTNAHVISKKVPKAIPPDQARVTFEVENARERSPKFYEVDEVLFTSPPGDLSYRCPKGEYLDVTIVKLRSLGRKYPALTVAAKLPIVESTSKAFVVGHPRGAGLQIALHDSLLLDIDDDERLVHYRTPTDPGSSGSPVFNIEFDVIALHHAGSHNTPRLHGNGTYEANEGISLAAIKRKLNR